MIKMRFPLSRLSFIHYPLRQINCSGFFFRCADAWKVQSSSIPLIQKGVNLLELMVGLAVGLMVVTAAVGTLILNKNTSTTITDSSVLTNQANNLLRILSYHVRHAGVLEFRPTGVPNTYLLDDPPQSPLCCEPPTPTAVLRGTEGDKWNQSDSLTVWAAHRADQVTRDCQGNAIPNHAALMRSFFYIDNNNLICVGATDDEEKILANNVEDFQVMYLLDNNSGSGVQWVTAFPGLDWNAVVAVDLCLQVRGEIKYSSNILSGVYENCKNASANHDGYMRSVVRQTIQIRNRLTNL
ncbi:MAG: PilW family protein [Burkholderiales bacterium]